MLIKILMNESNLLFFLCVVPVSLLPNSGQKLKLSRAVSEGTSLVPSVLDPMHIVLPFTLLGANVLASSQTQLLTSDLERKLWKRSAKGSK